MGVVNINQRAGEDIVDWLDRAAESFAANVPGERNPYQAAAAEIRGLRIVQACGDDVIERAT